jgi:hypothetical protein
MEQRPLRLGDIVDDYCPRERRVTNHVIVALVKDGIRQTRCSTCDTEHVFKAARLPRRKPKDDDQPAGVEPAVVDAIPAAPEPAPVTAAAPAPSPAPAAPSPAPVVEERADDIWPAHRTLIRAQLPRVEGEVKEPRPIPEFTMHQRGGRGPGMYRSDSWSNGNGHGRGGGGGGFRQGPPGPPRDHNSGQPGGQPGAGGGGKRRRHRRRGRGPGPGPKVG